MNKFLHRNILFQIAHPLTDKLVVAPVWPNSQNSSKNCSVDEQAQVVQNLGGKGIILQSSNFNSNFSSTNYTGDDTIVVSLYKKDDNQACSDLLTFDNNRGKTGVDILQKKSKNAQGGKYSAQAKFR